MGEAGRVWTSPGCRKEDRRALRPGVREPVAPEWGSLRQPTSEPILARRVWVRHVRNG